MISRAYLKNMQMMFRKSVEPEPEEDCPFVLCLSDDGRLSLEWIRPYQKRNIEKRTPRMKP